jgi:GAF domain-containing protein
MKTSLLSARSPSVLATRSTGRLAAGLAIALGGTFLGVVIARNTDNAFKGLPFLLAVVLATIVEGWVSGLVAVVVTSIAIDVWVMHPTGRTELTAPDIVSIATFVLSSLLVGGVVRRQQIDRARARRSAEQLSYLAGAGSVLEETLDYEEALRRFARYVVPAIGDWCAVHLVNAEGDFDLVAVAHEDPQKVELAREYHSRYPVDAGATAGIPVVVRTGVPELAPRIEPEMLRAAIADPEQVRRVEELGLRSVIIVPLTARGRTFGTLTLAVSHDHRLYTQQDLNFAVELAQRAAISIDTLRSYHEATVASSRNEILQKFATSLSRAATIADVVEALVRDVVVELPADAALIAVVEHDTTLRIVGQLGYRQEAIEDFDTFPISAELPMSDAVRERRPIVLSSSAERDARYPLLAGRTMADHALVCVPLPARNRVVGGMSISFPPPRDPDVAELEFLMAIGSQAGAAIQRAALYDERDHTAHVLQRSLLPGALPPIPGLELAARYWPAGDGNEVGGDFYDVFRIGEDRWLALIGDVCGTGPEAAAVMGMARHAAWAIGSRAGTAGELLQELNRIITPHVEENRFCTVCAVVIELAGGGFTASIASAGHPLPLLLRGDERVLVGEPGTMLGVFDELVVPTVTTTLLVGDALVMYTDGVTERGRTNRDFDEDLAMLEATANAASEGADEIAIAVERSLAADQPLEDDAAVLVIRRPA